MPVEALPTVQHGFERQHATFYQSGIKIDLRKEEALRKRVVSCGRSSI